VRRAGGRGRLAALLAGALLVSGTTLADGIPPGGALFSIPVEYAGTAPVPAGAPLRVVLHATDAARLSHLLGVPAPAAGTASFEYTLGAYPALPSAPSRTWLEPTWVVDFDEPDVAALHRAYRAARDGPPTTRSLVAFVAETVQGTLDQGFEIASVVARRRTGDCTEHAVLTAALARAAGLPARVVLGLALVETATGYAAYGHAWAETLEGGQWRVADAALADLERPARYVPFGILEDEGPGYTMGLANLGSSWILSVVVLGAANAAP
jgi:transglutaminase-like putative cysteine protease